MTRAGGSDEWSWCCAGSEDAEAPLSPRGHVFHADPNAKPLFPAAYRGGVHARPDYSCLPWTHVSPTLSLTSVTQNLDITHHGVTRHLAKVSGALHAEVTYNLVQCQRRRPRQLTAQHSCRLAGTAQPPGSLGQARAPAHLPMTLPSWY